MTLLDWAFVCVPILIVCWIGFKTQRYTKDVSDFLVSGRVAGRYVLSISSGQAGFGLISLIAMFQLFLETGLSLSFWDSIGIPISILVALSGFIVYRFRETRAMTLSQFLEIRYGRSFRIFTGVLQALSGIVNYGLFPGVTARFFVYYMNLPLYIDFMGIRLSTLMIVMIILLSIAVLIATQGGQVTIMVTDCVQGILAYPMYLAVVAAIVWRFSWWDHITPVLSSAPAGKSMINPFDISSLRDFNLFYVIAGAIATTYNLISWSGTQGYNAAALNPHEQKMGRVLGVWRAGFSHTMYVLLAVAAIAYFNHSDFSMEASMTRQRLDAKVLNDITTSSVYQYSHFEAVSIEEKIEDLSLKEKQVFDQIKHQMTVPMALRDLLPVGITGIFCAIAIFLTITTDTTYLHSWGSIVVQDIFLPIYNRKLPLKIHLALLRSVICGVAVYAFVFSYFFGQITYILMFMALTGAIWLGGAGTVIIGGLYWKKGTTAAAWATVIVSAVFAIMGFICTNYWVEIIYPMIEKFPLFLNIITVIVSSISNCFEPVISWQISADRFFMNGQEVYFTSIVISMLTYFIFSLATCKKPFNLERMLHRGIYDANKEHIEAEVILTKKSLTGRLVKDLVGIDSEFSKADKILSWSVFIYWFGLIFGCWLIVVILNVFVFKWPDSWWSVWHFVYYIVLGTIVGLVSTVWFFICGILDIKKLFCRLSNRVRDTEDDGRVPDIVGEQRDGILHLQEENK